MQYCEVKSKENRLYCSNWLFAVCFVILVHICIWSRELINTMDGIGTESQYIAVDKMGAGNSPPPCWVPHFFWGSNLLNSTHWRWRGPKSKADGPFHPSLFLPLLASRHRGPLCITSDLNHSHIWGQEDHTMGLFLLLFSICVQYIHSFSWASFLPWLH